MVFVHFWFSCKNVSLPGGTPIEKVCGYALPDRPPFLRPKDIGQTPLLELTYRIDPIFQPTYRIDPQFLQNFHFYHMILPKNINFYPNFWQNCLFLPLFQSKMYRIDPIFWLKIYRIDPLFSHIYIDIASFFRPRQSLPVLFGGECPPGVSLQFVTCM